MHQTKPCVIWSVRSTWSRLGLGLGEGLALHPGCRLFLRLWDLGRAGAGGWDWAYSKPNKAKKATPHGMMRRCPSFMSWHDGKWDMTSWQSWYMNVTMLGSCTTQLCGLWCPSPLLWWWNYGGWKWGVIEKTKILTTIPGPGESQGRLWEPG